MLSQRCLAFVDVETTGMSPLRDRIIEIAVVRVQWPADDTGPPEVSRFSSLVDPGCAIDPGIRYLTGISSERVRDAPRFGEIAPVVRQWLDGALFIAHQARFDYGFLKAEFGRLGEDFSADTLCTVRLSRALAPDRSPHSLDALIARYRLGNPERHRAAGDAEVLWRLLQKLAFEHGGDALRQAAGRLLAKPSLPAHLGVPSIEALPARPGIYAFLGLNDQPLYIGKSLNLRERVPSHFSADHRSERGLRLASETRRLVWQTRAGEFGALLAEAEAIGRLMPAQNRALRAARRPVVWRLGDAGGRASLCPWDGTTPEGAWAGPFTTRQAARTWLTEAARVHRVCLKTLGLERGGEGRACFARQIGRCPGTCTGEAPLTDHMRTLHDLFVHARPPRWPPGLRLLLRETDPRASARSWHMVGDWRWLGSADEAAALDDLLAAAPRGAAVGAGSLLSDRPHTAAADVRQHRLLRQWLDPVLADTDPPRVLTHAQANALSVSEDPPWQMLPRRHRGDACRYAVAWVGTEERS